MLSKFEVRKNGVFAELSGIVTTEELLEMNDRFLEELFKKPYEYQLVHFRNVADFFISANVLRKIAIQDCDAFKKHPVLKIATVSTSKLVYGITRMYDAFSSGSTATNRIFETLEEAENWVNGIEKQ